MAEVDRVPDKPLKDLCNRRFRAFIHQQARNLVGEIVASGTVHRPILRQRFISRENFFNDQINRAAVFRQLLMKNLGATQLHFLEIVTG